MFDAMHYMTEHGHEQLVYNYDEETGLRALIAIHSTTLGPSLGGTRLWTYADTESAVLDVLRLSEGMTYKAAVAGLPLGGGKAVIMADGKENDPLIRAARFRAFGRFVDSLSGRYITAEDVGTKIEDMVEIHTQTQHATGLPFAQGGSGDPSPMTAFGVMMGIRAGVKHVFGNTNLAGMRVAIQGLGKVGYALAEYLVNEGVTVVATDIRPAVLQEAEAKMGIQTVATDTIYDVDCDVFAPCALGAVLNDTTIPRLKCRMVAGAANNQLTDVDKHSQMLQEREITYLVDYVLNSGGIINIYTEINGYDETRARERTGGVYRTIERMLTIADREGITTQAASEQMANEALNQKAPIGV